MAIMGEKRALGGWLVVGCLLAMPGCDRGGGDGGSGVQVDVGSQPPAIGRPADATVGPRVGVVVAASSDVRVVPSQGAPFAATEGTMLVRDDRLSTGSGAASFVVVELYNGHIVRFNQGTSIVVGGISVFGAAPAGDDLAARFERVLRPEEQGDERLRGAISRVAGWNSRMTATETIAPLSAPARSGQDAPGRGQLDDAELGAAAEVANGLELDEPIGRGKSDVKKAEHSEPPRDPQDKSSTSEPSKNKKPAPSESPEPRMPPKNKSPESETPATPDDAPDAGDGLETSKPEAPKPVGTLDLPDKVKFVPESGPAETVKLPAALVLGRKVLAQCAGAGAKIKVRIESEVIVEITVEGGTGAKCTEGKGRGVKLVDGTLELRVSP